MSNHSHWNRMVILTIGFPDFENQKQSIWKNYELFVDNRSNGSPSNLLPSNSSGVVGPSYASTVKAGTSDED